MPAAPEFRSYLPDLSTPRFQTARTQDATAYAAAFRDTQNPPWLYKLTEVWEELLAEPYAGITTDGTVKTDLFVKQDENVPVKSITTAAHKLLQQLSEEQRAQVKHPINARKWRSWSNPEFLLRPFGIRLEEVPINIIESILRIIEKSFSAEGYRKALTAMRLNHFLGQLCDMSRVMNQYSYSFLLFGDISEYNAWGWSLYGHHLCLNVLILPNGQTVISPTFTGAEPNVIDSGPWSGSSILHIEGDLGLKLMQSLPKSIQKRARIFEKLKDPAMIRHDDLRLDRWNPDDQRHLCGAFRDNRVVPYEGMLAADFTAAQISLLLEIVEEFVLYLPDGARKKRLELVERHLSETYFCWIGGYEDHDAFYYRIQSPVIVCEFDHHSGVFLTNTEPARFHTHTIVRTPNGGDYGNVLRNEAEKLQ